MGGKKIHEQGFSCKLRFTYAYYALTNPFGTDRKQSNSPKLTVPVMARPLIRSAVRYSSEVRRKSGKGDKED